MKKKGFTLVELLAVIAILAILVIIALPNVMGMFNQAKQNSFTTELKEIYKQAQQQWISDSMINTSQITYYCAGGTSGATATTGTAHAIDLTGRQQLDYYIVVDKAGNIVQYFATDGSYQYAYYSTSALNVEEIDDGKTRVDQLLSASGTTWSTVTKDDSHTKSNTNLLNNTVYQVSTLNTESTSKQILHVASTGVTLTQN